MQNLIHKLALVGLNYISMKLLLFHFDKYLLEMFLPKYYRRGLCKKNAFPNNKRYFFDFFVNYKLFFCFQ